jgi:hypothetical protein
LQFQVPPPDEELLLEDEDDVVPPTQLRVAESHVPPQQSAVVEQGLPAGAQQWPPWQISTGSQKQWEFWLHAPWAMLVQMPGPPTGPLHQAVPALSPQQSAVSPHTFPGARHAHTLLVHTCVRQSRPVLHASPTALAVQ